MPHLSLDLDALERVPEVASAAGLPRGEVLFGLCGLWRWCWRERTDRILSEQLAAFFSPSTERLAGALIAFGFLATVPDGYRVRGAGRYLRVKEAQKLAAERTNAKRYTERSSDGTPSGLPSVGIPTATPTATPSGIPTAGPSGQATVGTPSPPTPPSSPSEQRTASSEAPAPAREGSSTRLARIARWHADAMRSLRGYRAVLEDFDGAGVCASTLAPLSDEDCERVIRAFVADKADDWLEDQWETKKRRTLRWLSAERVNAYLAPPPPSRMVSAAVIAALDVCPNGPEDDLDH